MSISVESIDGNPIEQPVTEPVVEQVVEPMVETVVEPLAETVMEQQVDQVVEPTTKVKVSKPRGHRLKDPNTRKPTEKVQCPGCSKTVSLHTLRYSHQKCVKVETKKIAKPSPKEPVNTPVEEILHQRIMENAKTIQPITVAFDINEEIRKMLHLEKVNKKVMVKEKYKKLLFNKI
jgi:hypothetical protein